MTTLEIQKELEIRANSVKERSKGQPWGEKEVRFYRSIYKDTQEHIKVREALKREKGKNKNLYELAYMYNQAFLMLSGCNDLPLRTDSPTPIGTLILMRVIGLAPDSIEVTTLKRFIINAFNPARFIPRTQYGTFGNGKYENAKLERHTYHDENQSQR